MKINKKNTFIYINSNIYNFYIFNITYCFNFFLGHSTVGIISKARPFALKDNSEALVTSFKVNDKLIDDWQTERREY